MWLSSNEPHSYGHLGIKHDLRRLRFKLENITHKSCTLFYFAQDYIIPRNELSLSKAAMVWRSFYHPRDITASLHVKSFFLVPPIRDETHDGLAWEAVKVSAELAAEDSLNTDDHFYKIPAPTHRIHLLPETL